ncbi:single-stranded DNA-binding protein [Antribacter gilvus]|uniref:single-stranded DNA-binding protein n=1 Tax=Antribacter gilvus TaxID=2304675 RepID=UPI000F79E3D8|nr:single-stranded DNA-binding protein [Antribacter gilvus]
MSDVMVTVNGYVGTKPVVYRSAATGAEWTSFRVGSTRRVINRATGEWADGPTIWFTVKAWREAGRNVAGSIDKGDPVLVHGRLAVEQWEGPDNQQRSTLVVLATSVGPDVTRGTARFTRIVTTQAQAPDGALPDDGAAARGVPVTLVGGPAGAGPAGGGLTGGQAASADPWRVGGGEPADLGDEAGGRPDEELEAALAADGDEGDSEEGGDVTDGAGRAGRRTA